MIILPQQSYRALTLYLYFFKTNKHKSNQLYQLIFLFIINLKKKQFQLQQHTKLPRILLPVVLIPQRSGVQDNRLKNAKQKKQKKIIKTVSVFAHILLVFNNFISLYRSHIVLFYS